MTQRDAYAIGIDLGGTNLRAGLFDPGGKLLARAGVATDVAGGPAAVVRQAARLVEQLVGEAGCPWEHVCAVGIGAPGPMSHARGVVFKAPNIPGWVNVPLRDMLREATGLPCTVENDANAAAFGEFRALAGGGSGVTDLVLLTLGTGVGGGIVLGGQLLRGKKDNAGEIGHLIVEPSGRQCPCGQRGCLERYASARAVGQRAAEALDAGEASLLRVVHESGSALDAQRVEAAAVAGDALARRIWDDTCRYLAIAIVAIQHLLNPDVVVLAGGLIGANERLLDPVQRHFRELTWSAADDGPDIALARLGDDAGIRGAAELARMEARSVQGR